MRKHFFFSLCLLQLLFFSSSTEGHSILSDYYARTWGIEQNLPQGTIPCLAQTADGYIWMGTQESLSRFDGVRFTNFTTKNTPVMKSSWIQSMTLSQSQGLIIGTWRGGIYRVEGNRISPLTKNQKTELDQAIVFALAVTADDTIWAGTSDGLFSFHEGQYRHYNENDGFPADTVRSLIADSGGTLWIGSQDQGLWTVQNGVFTQVNETDSMLGSRIWALCRDGEKGIWIGNGIILSHWDGQVFSHVKVPVQKPSNLITGLARSEDGSVWLGLQNEGIWQYKDGEFRGISEKDGLNSNLSQSVLVDREQNVWVGTNGSGVTQLVRNKIRVISRDEGLSAKEIWTVRESEDGSLWIGTHGGGLNRLMDGVIRQYDLKFGLPSLFITALHQSPADKSLWVGTGDNGIIRIQGEDISHINLGSKLTENTVYAISEQSDGTLMVGTESGIAYWKNDSVVRWLTVRDGLSHNSVREFTQIPDSDEFWVATDIGLNLLSKDRVTASWKKSDGLSEDALNGLYLDRDNMLWICTYGGGLIHFDRETFTAFTSNEGLHNDVIYDLVEDDNGLMWMSSNRGVFAVRKSELLDFIQHRTRRITSFPLGIGDGLKALECNGGRQPAVWLTRSGMAAFATINGVALLDTKQFRTDEPAPDVIVEALRINEKPFELVSPLSVPPGRRNLDIDFTAPFFSAPEKIRFQYRLLPFDEDWQESRSLRTAHYTNIPHGEYTFELRSSNRFGIWNDKVARMQIVFRPFFYETVSFRLLLAFVLFVLVMLYLRLRTRKLEKSKKELEQAVALRTRELKEAYDKMEKLSLTDTLTSLFNRRYFHNIIDREIRLVVRQCSKPKDNSISFAMGFLMIDIDHFKQINDQHGHLCGDLFLQMISKRFLSTLRTSDLIVRWGGEEFLVISKENDFDGAKKLCKRLLRAINSEPFECKGKVINGSVSVGFCPFPVSAGTPELLSWEETVKLADLALYQAKNSGRNCAFGIRMNAAKLTEENLRIMREDFTQAVEQKIIELIRVDD